MPRTRPVNRSEHAGSPRRISPVHAVGGVPCGSRRTVRPLSVNVASMPPARFQVLKSVGSGGCVGTMVRPLNVVGVTVDGAAVSRRDFVATTVPPATSVSTASTAPPMIHHFRAPDRRGGPDLLARNRIGRPPTTPIPAVAVARTDPGASRARAASRAGTAASWVAD